MMNMDIEMINNDDLEHWNNKPRKSLLLIRGGCQKTVP